MPTTSPSPSPVAWAATNLLLVIAGCIAWGWLDYRYVTWVWSEAEMRSAAQVIPPALAIAAMVVNLWLLRRRSAAFHVGVAFASALGVVGLWWLVIALAGPAFHVAIGGTPG